MNFQRAVRLNDFRSLEAVLALLSRLGGDDYVSRCLSEFARLDRAAYIKANDILDRLFRLRPEYLAAFERYLLGTINARLPPPVQPDGDWARYTAPAHHLYFDLWADVIRRKLVKRVQYEGTVWKPTIMCIEITQQCNAVCGHCASNSSPATKIRLGPEKVRTIVEQAAREGMEYLGLTGGEPFLELATLLEAIRTATANGVRFDYINSNCFWAKTVAKATAILQRIREVAHPTHVKRKRGMFSLSLTTEHLRWVPLQNFANVIHAHEQVLPGQTLEIVSVRGELFGKPQEESFLQLIALLGDHVQHGERDHEGMISRICTRGGEIDVFFNYLVPIGRGEDMPYDAYKHYQLTDKELARGLSALHIDGKVAQTITIGWDGKCAPDVVLKCSESVIAGNLYLDSFAEVERSANNDPLVRGILTSVHRIIEVSRRTGIFELMQTKLQQHSSIQGYVSEFMKDPKKRLLMTLDLLSADIEAGLPVRDERGTALRDVKPLVAELVSGIAGERMLAALRTLVRTFTYDFNFTATRITQSGLRDQSWNYGELAKYSRRVAALLHQAGTDAVLRARRAASRAAAGFVGGCVAYPDQHPIRHPHGAHRAQQP